MRVYISEEELYPCYTIWNAKDSNNQIEVEMPDELYERYKAAMKQFTDVQTSLQMIWDLDFKSKFEGLTIK